MKVVLYGATGHAGSCILNELVSRHHTVIGVVRNPERIPSGIEREKDDLSNVDKITQIIKGSDAVISAVSTPSGHTEGLVTMTENLVSAVKKAKVPRLLTVGGCGSLEYDPGVTVMDSGHWPEKYMPHAKAHLQALNVLRNSNINWTSLSPSLVIENGERTGKFRLETEKLIKDSQGNSRISFEDFAVAMVNELEKPQYEHQRFTVGY